MNAGDLFNISLVTDNQDIDGINKRFYGRFNFPWRPSMLQTFSGKGLIGFLNQDLGFYGRNIIPENPRIWVAGCGTNQALITALRFPQATVLGTDLSSESIDICRENARLVNAANLQLMEISINDSQFSDEFDYVICTGVIHHNANPEKTLLKLAQGLKKGGILELMVYNYYHRIITTACQSAVKLMTKGSEDLGIQFNIARLLASKYPLQNLVSEFLFEYQVASDAELADSLFQPVEYSYTVESLNRIVENCNMEILLPCLNQFDKSKGSTDWTLNFGDKQLDALLRDMPDVKRWQATNLLKLNDSPMLWFYIQRQDSGRVRKTEAEVCEDFLDSTFEKFTTDTQAYIFEDGNYVLSTEKMPFPLPSIPADSLSALVFNSYDPSKPLRETLDRLGIEPDFEIVNRLRINLSTLAHPFLLCKNGTAAINGAKWTFRKECSCPDKIATVLTDRIANCKDYHPWLFSKKMNWKMSVFLLSIKYGPGLLYRRFTASRRVFPNLFILGAPKAGTSSLAEYLHMHPSYLPGYTKEIMFLQKIQHFQSNWEDHVMVRFLWQKHNGNVHRYLKFFPTNEEFLQIERSTGKAYTGDHTPFYLYCPRSLEFIKKYSPNAKVVILLRDPVERAFSDYNMHRKRDPSETRSFEIAIKEEVEGRMLDFRKNYLYQSIYAPHVQRVKTMFRAENVMIFSSERFFADPQHVWRTLLGFLELPLVQPDFFSIHNKGNYPSQLTEETLLRLKEYFRPHNMKLYEMLGEDLGWD